MADQQRVVKLNGVTHVFPADATDAEVQAALEAELAPMASHEPAAAAGPSMTERAVDALPMAGGFAGGVIGGAGGPLTAVAGAALGGASGESIRQLVRRAMGLSAPSSPMAAATDIVKEGALNGATEGAGRAVVGGARLMGRGLMRAAIRPSAAIQRDFPDVDVVDIALRNRVPVGRVTRTQARGSAVARSLQMASSQRLRALLSKAEAAGREFTPDEVLTPVLDLIDDIAKQPLRRQDERALDGMIREFLADHPGPLTPNAVKDLKKTAQQIARPIMAARNRGQVVEASASMEGRFNDVVAKGSQRALGTIDGALENERETQGLIALTKAIRDAEQLRPSLTTQSAGTAAAVVAGLLNPGSSLPEATRRSVISYLAARGLASPTITSRVALGLTQPQVNALMAQFPRLAVEVVHQLGLEESQKRQADQE